MTARRLALPGTLERRRWRSPAILLLLQLVSGMLGAQGAPADLRGLWEATLRFGPDVHGQLILLRSANAWRADIAGFSLAATVRGETISFELPGGRGSFRGVRSGDEVRGQWIQPVTQYSGRGYATPVTLRPDGAGRWRGNVTPYEDRFTFYLPVSAQADGTLRTYLRNPERNQGRFMRVSRIALNGADVLLTGSGPNAPSVRGHYEDGVISLPLRGGTYDFTRVQAEASSPFYPRGSPAPRYRYAPPLATGDGWPVGSVEDVGISREAIEQFVQRVLDMPMDSLGTHQLHALLIARHGRLVVEEYFHGYHRDMPHETRSAAKSWTAVLIGAAMQAGIPIRTNTPVYATMLDQLPADLDPRKRAMTLDHLMAMTAGFNCNPDDSTSANEDVMDGRGVEDWYRYTLEVPLVSAPGEKVFYCSTEPNLAAGMVAKIAREPLPELFDRLVARPLQMGTYHLFLQPMGEAYGGGSHLFLPRDFLKLPQLLLNDGAWNGRQVLAPGELRRIAASLRDLTPTQQYARLWNSVEYDYGNGGKKVRAYFAGGNGGQIFMAIPDLDLAIGFTGGNYADAATFVAQRDYVPQYVLPAVR
ncbi:MAG TPA: serine hydrolase domain-containing protein [Gemmatimonadales bacterium]|nr:serine hydrolase domain-containing protein [Gemmatimonadales bacterium]